MTRDSMTCFELRAGDHRFFIEFERVNRRTIVSIDGRKQYIVRLESQDNGVLHAYLDSDEKPRSVSILDETFPKLSIRVDGVETNFTRSLTTEVNLHRDRGGNILRSSAHFQPRPKIWNQRTKDPNVLVSPSPGKIIEIMAKQGQKLAEGEIILIIESMKMETKFLAEREVIVTEILAENGDSVRKGQVLVRFG